MKSTFTVCVCLVLLLVCNHSRAQQTDQKSDKNVYDFLPREKVIFEDDFSDDEAGDFPAKWKRLGAGASRSPKHCQVQEGGSGHVLVTSDIISDLEPIIKNDSNLTDSFTLEYDFLLGNADATVDVDFRAKRTEPRSFDWFHISGSGAVFYVNLNAGDKQSFDYPGFRCNVWHHLAFSYNKGVMKLYMDQYHVFTLSMYYGYPLLGFALHCTPPGKYKDIRLATGAENSSFNKIITEKKFVTHAIHFDILQSVIKLESMGYIMQLVHFLQTNPTVNLEIDGHTDNEGDSKFNKKLSLERAEEVKKQLEAAGVESNRLTAKGFGDTKPIQSNKTSKGRAENRRVEFIKL